MELRRRPPLVPGLRVGSLDSNVPSQPSSSYTPTSRLAPPIIVIDEATSDGSMLEEPITGAHAMKVEEVATELPHIVVTHSPYVSEDSHSQNAMFTMMGSSVESIMSEDTPTILSDGPPMLTNDDSCSMIGGRSSPFMGSASNSDLLCVSRARSPRMSDRKSPLLTVDPSYVNQGCGSSQVMNGCKSSLLTVSSPLLQGNRHSPTLRVDPPPMMINSSSLLHSSKSPLFGSETSSTAKTISPSNSGCTSSLLRVQPLDINNMCSHSMTECESSLLRVETSFNDSPIIKDCMSPYSNNTNAINQKSSILMNSYEPIIQAIDTPQTKVLGTPYCKDKAEMTQFLINNCQSITDQMPLIADSGSLLSNASGETSRINANLSLIRNRSASLTRQNAVQMDNDIPTPLIQSVPAAETSEIHSNGRDPGKTSQVLLENIHNSIINVGPSASACQLPSQNFDSNSSRTGVAEMNWLLTQDASEPSFENWLGQIIKADNLTDGCSLPQKNNSNMNFV